MKLERLLEKDDRKKYQLLRYLDKYPNQKIRNTTVQQDLGFSYYLVNNMVEQIVKDLADFQLEQFFNIEINDSYLIFYELENVNTSVFLRHYLNRATQAKILTTIFLEKRFTITDFSESHFFSYTYVYRRFSALKESLLSWGIKLNRKNQLVGDELTIRSLMMHLFMASAQDLSVYDPQKAALGNGLLLVIQKHLPEIQETGKLELLHFIGIGLHRMENGHFIDLGADRTAFLSCAKGLSQALLQELKETIGSQIDLTDETMQKEVKNFLGYLTVSNLITEEPACYPDWIVAEARQLPETIEAHFALTLAPDTREFLTRRLLSLLVDVHFLHYQSNMFDDYLEVDYFQRAYPEFFEFCRDYVARTYSHKLKPHSRNYLFYFLLLALVSHIRIEEVTDPVNVCIDFSLGKDYDRIIENDLKYFSTMNIQITATADTTTDVIITDMVQIYQGHPAAKIIWLTPPRPEDWENLVNRLIQLRKGRVTTN